METNAVPQAPLCPNKLPFLNFLLHHQSLSLPGPKYCQTFASLFYVLYPISYKVLSILPLKCLLARNPPVANTAIANPIPIPSYSSRQNPSFVRCGSKRDSTPVRSQKLSGGPAGAQERPCSRPGGCAAGRTQPGWASWQWLGGILSDDTEGPGWDVLREGSWQVPLPSRQPEVRDPKGGRSWGLVSPPTQLRKF